MRVIVDWELDIVFMTRRGKNGWTPNLARFLFLTLIGSIYRRRDEESRRSASEEQSVAERSTLGELIRVMLCELFRIARAMAWYGTFAIYRLAFTVLHMFNNREFILKMVEGTLWPHDPTGSYRWRRSDLPRDFSEPILQSPKILIQPQVISL